MVIDVRSEGGGAAVRTLDEALMKLRAAKAANPAVAVDIVLHQAAAAIGAVIEADFANHIDF